MCDNNKKSSIFFNGMGRIIISAKKVGVEEAETIQQHSTWPPAVCVPSIFPIMSRRKRGRNMHVPNVSNS